MVSGVIYVIEALRTARGTVYLLMRVGRGGMGGGKVEHNLEKGAV